MTYYVVIAEYKNDAPIAHETYIHTASYAEAYNRIKMLESGSSVVRVAMAKLVYEYGNETLIPKEKL